MSGLGATPPQLQELPQLKTRCTFLYLERCSVNRQDSAITVTDIRGTVHIPAASLSVIMLGPGTSITHRAVELISDTGVSTVWVGEQGVKYYAHGRPLTASSKLLTAQATLVSNVQLRASVARKMYALRFPNEDIEGLTIQQLRGREGTRVKATYNEAALKTGVIWDGRRYDPNDFHAGTPINKALSVAHTCLYGLVHSVVVALGLSPGLGFVHTGHERSFIYDIADLYKAEVTIPIAFRVVAECDAGADISSLTRHAVRDAFQKTKLITRIVQDVQQLLLGDEQALLEANVLYLWDDKLGEVQGHKLYAEDTFEEGYGEIL